VAGSAAEGDSREPLHENKFGKAYEVIISAEKPPLKRNFGELFCGLGKSQENSWKVHVNRGGRKFKSSIQCRHYAFTQSKMDIKT